jgi:hypothetical protein
MALVNARRVHPKFARTAEDFYCLFGSGFASFGCPQLARPAGFCGLQQAGSDLGYTSGEAGPRGSSPRPAANISATQNGDITMCRTSPARHSDFRRHNIFVDTNIRI